MTEKKKNKKDRNYIIAAGIGIVLWMSSLVILLALILNNPDQKAVVIYLLFAFIIIGAVLDFLAILHFVLIYFKEIANENEKEKKQIIEDSDNEEDVHDLVDRMLNNDNKNSKS